jgi:hypothetical protein
MVHKPLPEHELRWMIRQLERIARKSPGKARKRVRRATLFASTRPFAALLKTIEAIGISDEVHDRVILRAIARRLTEALPAISDSSPRSWRPRFPYWQRTVDDEDKRLADIMRNAGVPEEQHDSVRRSYERWRAGRCDK